MHLRPWGAGICLWHVPEGSTPGDPSPGGARSPLWPGLGAPTPQGSEEPQSPGPRAPGAAGSHCDPAGPSLGLSLLPGEGITSLPAPGTSKPDTHEAPTPRARSGPNGITAPEPAPCRGRDPRGERTSSQNRAPSDLLPTRRRRERRFPSRQQPRASHSEFSGLKAGVPAPRPAPMPCVGSLSHRGPDFQVPSPHPALVKAEPPNLRLREAQAAGTPPLLSYNRKCGAHSSDQKTSPQPGTPPPTPVPGHPLAFSRQNAMKPGRGGGTQPTRRSKRNERGKADTGCRGVTSGKRVLTGLACAVCKQRAEATENGSKTWSGG